ncbi:MAG: hypothetical protein ACRBB3_03605 [Alphaproteobacteria bacterium]
MLLRLTACLSLFAITIGMPYMAHAESADDLVKAQSETLKGIVSDLVPTLTREEAAHFIALYKNYTLYSMVKAVDADVNNAVSKCADNNKSMKDELENRFEEWEKKVGTTLKEAHANINNMAISQSYIPQSNLNTMFGLIEEIRAVNSSRFETTPVTTPEACEFMISKMDETEESMGRMLKETLSSYPNLLKATQQ